MYSIHACSVVTSASVARPSIAFQRSEQYSVSAATSQSHKPSLELSAASA
jgi:hypothetical protein